MSHTQGTVKTQDETLLGYFEYNATVDVARHQIFRTEDALAENWRLPQIAACSCLGEPVTLRATLRWKGLACAKHMCITGNLAPPDDNWDDASTED